MSFNLGKAREEEQSQLREQQQQEREITVTATTTVPATAAGTGLRLDLGGSSRGGRGTTATKKQGSFSNFLISSGSRSSKSAGLPAGLSGYEEDFHGVGLSDSFSHSSYGSIEYADADVDPDDDDTVLDLKVDTNNDNFHNLYQNLCQKPYQRQPPLLPPNITTLHRISSRSSCNDLPEDLFPINEEFICVEG